MGRGEGGKRPRAKQKRQWDVGEMQRDGGMGLSGYSLLFLEACQQLLNNVNIFPIVMHKTLKPFSEMECITLKGILFYHKLFHSLTMCRKKNMSRGLFSCSKQFVHRFSDCFFIHILKGELAIFFIGLSDGWSMMLFGLKTKI